MLPKGTTGGKNATSGNTKLNIVNQAPPSHDNFVPSDDEDANESGSASTNEPEEETGDVSSSDVAEKPKDDTSDWVPVTGGKEHG